jgi:hypothetical protein
LAYYRQRLCSECIGAGARVPDKRQGLAGEHIGTADDPVAPAWTL